MTDASRQASDGESALTPLRGRKVVVTGSGGISTATVAALLREGARVHVVARNPSSAAALVESQPSVTWSAADLTDDGMAARAFDDAVGQLGGIDGLVAVAGGSGRSMGDGPVHELSSEGLRATVDLNLVTCTNALREFVVRCLSLRPDFSSAVLIGSSLGRFPASPLFATHAYAATKAAIEGLARAAAAHYRDEQIAINVVAPGLTRTPMAARAQQDPVVTAYARRRQVLADDGFVDPREVAAACAWILAARSVTGQTVYVDGGWSVFG